MNEIVLEKPKDIPPKDPIPCVEFVKTIHLIKQEETNDTGED